jgi:hypothetical protein
MKRPNHYFESEGQTPSMKNLKGEDKRFEKNTGLTNRNLQTGEARKKKRKVI